MALAVEILDTSVHAREGFCSHDPTFEVFLKNKANKEHKQHISDTYVLVEEDNKSKILGYFTLSNHALILTDIPLELTRKLPNYSTIGTVLLGRMGRDRYLTSKGFGVILLKEAIKQSLERGSFFALELRAKNLELVEYYRKFGFIQLMDDKRRMILPYSILKELNIYET